MPPTLSAPPPAPAAAAPAAPSAPPSAPAVPKSGTTPPPSGNPAEPTPAKHSDESPSWMDGPNQELERLDDSNLKEPEKPKSKTVEKLVEKPKDEKEPEEPAKPEEAAAPVKPIKAAELRAAYETLKKERKEVLEPKIQQLEAKLKELETKSPEAIKPLEEKLAAIEKRNQELEDQIRFVDYTKSKEFSEKYKQPYVEAWTRAVSDFNQLTVKFTDGQDENGDPIVKQRQATADDLLHLANLPLSEMDAKAEEMFGRSAPRVIRHVEKVRELSDAQNKALAEAQKTGGERQKQTQAQAEAARKKQNDLWNQYNKDLADRFPKVFGPAEGDEEGNALLQKGFAHADRLFLPTDQTAPKTIEEMVQLHTILRNKSANHDRLLLRNKRLASELAETKKALEEYEKSTPPAGKGGSKSATPKSFDQELDEEIRAMDKP